MKSFKEYLTESKKVYEFKVKIAGDCPKDCGEQIQASLSEFHVASVGKGRTTPIQERQTEFPEHRNMAMTVFDVTTDYPATGEQIRDRIATGLGVTHSHVKVRSMAEEKEYAINHANDEKANGAIIGTEYTPSNNGDLHSEQFKMNFLKDLNKEKHQGTQVKGYNDQILAASSPAYVKETPGKQVEIKTKIENVFTKQVKLPKGVK